MTVAPARGSLFFVSAATLTLELYWIRAFAESEWGHLASMVVSTAMLGFGAGGTLVVVAGDSIVAAAPKIRISLLVAFLLLAGVGPGLAYAVPFEPLLLFWRPSAWLWVFVREAIVAAAFAAGATFIAAELRLARRGAPLAYGVNLFGSTFGVSVGLALMTCRPTADLHAAAMLLALTALAVQLRGMDRRMTAVVAGLAWTAATNCWSTPVLHPMKDLAAALRLPDARIVDDRPGLAGRWTVVESPALHTIPGLSLVSSEPLGPQRALFLQGDGAGTVFAHGGTGALRHRISWLPYAIRQPDTALLLGETTVMEIQSAVLANVSRIVAVIPSPRTRDALEGDLGRYAGIAVPPIELRSGGPRTALMVGERFDLVLLPPEDSLASSSAGLLAARESSLLTTEGLTAAIASTTESGHLCVPRWTQAPPRDLPRLVSTISAALRTLGIEELRHHLLLAQSWDAWIVCASRGGYDAAEIERLGEFAEGHGFDVLLPGPIGPLQHVLPGPDPGALVEGILARKGRVPEGYPFRIDPATDDRPFFHHFLAYHRLASYLRALRAGSLPTSEWGDFFLWASLCSVTILGALAIVAPALALSGPRGLVAATPAGTLLFACLGLGYMFFEVLFFHQGSRLTGLPGVAAAVVLLAFLAGSGVGAVWLSSVGAERAVGVIAALAGALGALLAAFVFDPFFQFALRRSPLARWSLLVVPAFVMAIPLGMPFPAGLARFGPRPGAIPWLVAVNGWMSVVGATAASLLAIATGFSRVGFAAAALYALAALLLYRLRGHR
jgi:hypothetical protein